jgi:hypothetical protein
MSRPHKWHFLMTFLTKNFMCILLFLHVCCISHPAHFYMLALQVLFRNTNCQALCYVIFSIHKLLHPFRSCWLLNILSVLLSCSQWEAARMHVLTLPCVYACLSSCPQIFMELFIGAFFWNLFSHSSLGYNFRTIHTCILAHISSIIRTLNIITWLSVTVDGVWISHWFYWTLTYTHNLQLQITVALLLVHTLYSSLEHTLESSQPVVSSPVFW